MVLIFLNGSINIPEGHTLVNGIPGNGLTKREEFARSAMQGILANTSCQSWDNMEATWASPSTVASKALEYADHMIAELNKPVTL